MIQIVSWTKSSILNPNQVAQASRDEGVKHGQVWALGALHSASNCSNKPLDHVALHGGIEEAPNNSSNNGQVIAEVPSHRKAQEALRVLGPAPTGANIICV